MCRTTEHQLGALGLLSAQTDSDIQGLVIKACTIGAAALFFGPPPVSQGLSLAVGAGCLISTRAIDAFIRNNIGALTDQVASIFGYTRHDLVTSIYTDMYHTDPGASLIEAMVGASAHLYALDSIRGSVANLRFAPNNWVSDPDADAAANAYADNQVIKDYDTWGDDFKAQVDDEKYAKAKYRLRFKVYPSAEVLASITRAPRPKTTETMDGRVAAAPGPWNTTNVGLVFQSAHGIDISQIPHHPAGEGPTRADEWANWANAKGSTIAQLQSAMSGGYDKDIVDGIKARAAASGKSSSNYVTTNQHSTAAGGPTGMNLLYPVLGGVGLGLIVLALRRRK